MKPEDVPVGKIFELLKKKVELIAKGRFFRNLYGLK